MHERTEVRSDREELVWVWGLPLARLTREAALQKTLDLVERREPAFVITANLNYAMVSAEERMDEVNRAAALILADGMPLVWASRFTSKPLPERITGADLLLELCSEGSKRGYRIYILGGPAGQGEEAGGALSKRFPGLVFAGTESPPFRKWTADEVEAMQARIHEARPDLLFVAFGQPKGERWIHENYRRLGVPLSIQIGGSFDFVTGRLRRAPRWMQKTGLEWVFRFLQEPRRLGSRYARNLYFIWRVTFGSLFSRHNALLVSPNPKRSSASLGVANGSGAATSQ